MSLVTSEILIQETEDLILPLDAFVRSVAIKSSTAHSIFLGAGASVSSGVPSAEACIWEWKRSIFLTKNLGLEEQFSELSLPSVRQRIQRWLDRQGQYPSLCSPDEYGFYIQSCYPISGDRRAYFEEKVRAARPHVGYHILCHLAQTGFFRSAWSTNFDGLVARACAGFELTPLEVGIDTQNRISRPPNRGEILCVSLHGDYRYDELKNTPQELRKQEEDLQRALVEELQDTPLIVAGYSGRDVSVLQALKAAYSKPGTGTLYWCGFGDGKPPDRVVELIRQARSARRNAFYVPSLGFDDLLTRLALHCLEGQARELADETISRLAPKDLLERSPFEITFQRTTTLIKSNAFEVECPSEVLQFELKSWPESRVWAWLREQTKDLPVVAVPHKGKVLAIGLVDHIRQIFGDNVKGYIERTPVATEEYRYEDGAIASLMRTVVTRAMADSMGIDAHRHEMWLQEQTQTSQRIDSRCVPHDSLLVFLRRIGGRQYLVLQPSIKVLDSSGKPVSHELAEPVKRTILGWQHNKPFNETVNRWREKLFPAAGQTTFEYPKDCGSTFSFTVSRAPTFAAISKKNDPAISHLEKFEHLRKQRGIELEEPPLVFCNRQAKGKILDTHPIRGLVSNRPFDFPLTSHGLLSSIKLAVVCPQKEAPKLASYLAKAQMTHRPSPSETDYLLNYPGFQQAYGLPMEIPQPGDAGWVSCPEPTESDPRRAAVEIASQINNAIQTLRSSYSTNVVVLIFFPERWDNFQRYRGERERFDVHDFVKAFCVQQGVATQFLNESTLADQQQCRVWWWLSLALYVKGMRTPWVLDNLQDETAFVGLGFSFDPAAGDGRHVVLGCSHIYSGRGEGLQYRLSKIEDFVIRGRNPFMSRDDARRVGESIRELFYEARMKLPRRVVLHKRTPFLKDEREGLLDGLGGVESIDMLEIQFDRALRYVAGRDGRSEDLYPVRRGTVVKLDDLTALLWVHGAAAAVNPRRKYFQGKRRIPAPLRIRRHVGQTDLSQISEE